MKISYECEYIINEILEDIELNGLDEPCVIFQDKNTGEFTDYLLASESQDEPFYIDETRYEMTLFEALLIFIEQNSVLDRGEMGYKILAVRNIAGLSQTALAEKIGVTQPDIARYENGDRTPKLENLKKIAKACKIDIKYLI